MKNQRVKGTVNTVQGTVRKDVGKLTGNLGLQAKGEAQVLEGKVQRGIDVVVRRIGGDSS